MKDVEMKEIDRSNLIAIGSAALIAVLGLALALSATSIVVKKDFSKTKEEVLFRASTVTGCKNPILVNFSEQFLIAEVDACGKKLIYEYNYATKNMTQVAK